MAVNLRKQVGKMLVTLLTGGVVLGLQNSNSEAAENSAAQAKAGSVEQFLMQMERNWAKAIVERNVANRRGGRGADNS